jgi:hypothetical protein
MFEFLPNYAAWLMRRSSQSVVFDSLCDLLHVSLPLILWKPACAKEIVAPPNKVKVNVLNWGDKMKIWDLLEDMFLAQVGHP